jgi:hypothetical protein
LVQGIVLVTFPAASTIFTDKSEYGLSSTQYGDMFLPQVTLAIATSLLGVGPLADSGVSLSRIFGFTAIIAAAMALLSFFVTRRPAPAGPAAGHGPDRVHARGRPRPR